MLLLALLLSVRPAGQPDIGPRAWQAAITSETRAWERHMELSTHEIRFGDIGVLEGSEICGMLKSDKLVLYSTSPVCRQAWRPRALTLHEMCHDRMKHVGSPLSRKETEHEAATCSKLYYYDKRKRK
jgi:hypothetical protein